MKTLRPWITFSWILLPAVLGGGGLLLRRLTLGDATAFQLPWIRAFHAHGAVLILLSIVYFLCLDRTSLSHRAKRVACAVLIVGVGALAGGFMVHALMGQPQQASAGTLITLSGGALVVGSLITLVYGLLKTPDPSATGTAPSTD